MTQKTPPQSSTQVVLEAVQDLHNQERRVTRKTLCALTGLKLSVVDDRIKALINDGMVVRIDAGVFVPADLHPPSRPISKTVLRGGMVKIEIGDDVLTLTPREDRVLAALQAGSVLQLSAIDANDQRDRAAAEMIERIKTLERSVRGA